MSQPTKRVCMITPPGSSEIHDGIGGRHGPGTTPVLPLDVANIFIERNLAVAFGDDAGTVEEQQRELAMEQTKREAETRAAEARKRMSVHDAMPAAVRQAAAEKEDLTLDHTGAIIAHAHEAGLYTEEQLRRDIEKYMAGARDEDKPAHLKKPPRRKG